MKDKRILLALFLVLSINAATYAQEVEGRADEVEIDLNTNTMTSESGIVLKQSNMKTKSIRCNVILMQGKPTIEMESLHKSIMKREK